MSTSTTQKPTTRRIVGMVVGIVIIGLGIALFKQSHLGNDSISALNMPGPILRTLNARMLLAPPT